MSKLLKRVIRKYWISLLSEAQIVHPANYDYNFANNDLACFHKENVLNFWLAKNPGLMFVIIWLAQSHWVVRTPQLDWTELINHIQETDKRGGSLSLPDYGDKNLRLTTGKIIGKLEGCMCLSSIQNQVQSDNHHW